MPLVDFIWNSFLIGAVLAIVVIVWKYAKGLKESPRELWLLFIYNIIEYSAYGAMNMAIILWLSKDCGLGDIAAGTYISGWSIMLSIIGMITGAVVDAIGIKRTMLISIIFLLISRFFMSFITNPVLIFILGFVPLAIGFAIVGPVISVAIKRYTTKEGAALGFGLFYVLMNLAYAIGGRLFDFVRDTFAQKDPVTHKIINENAGTVILGHHFSTYQLFFVMGFLFTIVSLFVVLFMRDGVELENGELVIKKKKLGNGIEAVKKASVDTWNMIKSVVVERTFWMFLGVLSITLFVRFIFFHFHYTFPKYGIRVLGEGAKIGNIYGVLNPTLIIFLVPLVATITKKVSSYKMLMVGSLVSSLSCFIAAVPAHYFKGWTDSILGEIIFVKWLGLAPNMQELMKNPPSPDYWPLIVFITVFTVGEAIWSPRLMQFTAEIAPKGKEGTYLALSVLPWFAAKFVVGPMSGWLLEKYVPLGPDGKALPHYPEHYMVWVWIGGMAILTPIALFLFKGFFNKYLIMIGAHDEVEGEKV